MCGAAALQVDYAKRTLTVDGKTYDEGDWLSIDGTAGEVYAGRIETRQCTFRGVHGQQSLAAGDIRRIDHAHMSAQRGTGRFGGLQGTGQRA